MDEAIKLLEQEIVQLKNKMREEVEKATLTINNLKMEIKNKKLQLGELRKVKKTDVLLDKYSSDTIRNGLYKAKYYEVSDLTSHRETGCSKSKCSTCLGYLFINNEFGDWQSKELNDWISQFMHNKKEIIDSPICDKLDNISSRISEN